MNKIIYAIVFLMSFTINSQNFQGQAYYKTQTAMDFGSWGDRMTSEQKKMMKERMKPLLEPVFILTFDKTKSIYQEEERLDAPGGSSSGWGRMMSSSGGPFYKNIISKKALQSTEFMGKKFLISYDQEKLKWVMQKEQKMIGNYLCFKATAQIEKPKTITSVWSKAEKENDSLKNRVSDKEKIEYSTVTAWYTPQIPVSHGPAQFGGLPGLILELNTEKTVMLCTKVIMNPDKKILISEPTKGEFVTRNEFDNIVEVKVKEMREMWRGGRSKSIRKN